jgi:hypothetical protein
MAGHHQIGNDQLRLVLQGQAQPFVAVARHMHGMSGGGKQLLEQQAHGRVVVHDEDVEVFQCLRCRRDLTFGLDFQCGKRHDLAYAEFQHRAPVFPFAQHLVAQRDEVAVGNAEFLCLRQELEEFRPAFLLRQEAEIGQLSRELEAIGQTAAACFDAEVGQLRRFMKQHGVGEQLGQAPVAHHRCGDVEVGVAEGFLFQRRQWWRELSTGLRYQRTIALGMQCRERHAPDVGEQAYRKQLGRRRGPCRRAEQLRGNAGGRRA